MKTKLYTLSLALIFSLFSFAQQKTTADNLATASSGLPDGVPDTWFSDASSAIQDMEYEFYPDQQGDHFRVANSRNHIGFIVEPTGYSVHAIRHTPDRINRVVNFKLLNIGREDKVSLPSTAFVVVRKKNALTYHSVPIDVEYITGIYWLNVYDEAQNRVKSVRIFMNKD